ncbi:MULTISPECIES: restriction endonuclease subunit S [Cyanophyceae]|uniref:restriction endonuclease subunit S n=1 Tax=Cyanophyceae TaxID=3028117 RepID=UPI00168254A4|nr:restriction endonuclease subunit S [Trichocoleus sp. FACHB-69]MBD1933303.1 restriction endonuclease subunit S [Trichocoleus sp. FACHB-69]
MEAEYLLAVPSRTKGREASTGVIPGRFALSVGHPALPTPPGWKWTKLSDVARLESGHTPSRRHPEYWDGEVPWIGIKDAVDNHGRTINDTYQHVTELGLANSSARLLPKNTVCLSRTASIGYVTVMGRPMATSQDFVNWVCSDGIEPQFLKAILIAEHESLWRFASGTTHQTIYYPEVKAFHVCLPPIQEQRAIARILSSLDDKIELNQQMNRTLEAIARAIFKSWFVDFDPVRAKMDGSQPVGMDAATADLFPDEFEESHLGKIPKGWKVGTIETECRLTMGQSPKSEFYNVTGDGLPFHQGVTNFGTRFPTHKTFCSVSERTANTGDILFSVRAPVGRINVADKKIIIGRGLSAIRHNQNYQSFLLYHLFHTFKEEDSIGTGTIYASVTRKEMQEIKLIIPLAAIVNFFDNQVKVIDKKIANNEKEARTLSRTRDILIPKLLSGKIQLKDAEKLAEMAAYGK